MELDYKSIGKRIKIARIQADITQETLSELVSISPSHMSNIETGTTHVSLTTIVAIANALQVTVDDLLCDSVVHCKEPFQNKIAALINSCDEYEIRIIRDTVNALLESLRRDKKLRKNKPTL